MPSLLTRLKWRIYGKPWDTMGYCPNCGEEIKRRNKMVTGRYRCPNSVFGENYQITCRPHAPHHDGEWLRRSLEEEPPSENESYQIGLPV